MPADLTSPPTRPARRRARRTRYLGFGLACVVLAIVAALTASWMPLAILVVTGAVFVTRGIAGP